MFLMNNYAEHLFMYFLAIICLPMSSLFKSFVNFLLHCFFIIELDDLFIYSGYKYFLRYFCFIYCPEVIFLSIHFLMLSSEQECSFWWSLFIHFYGYCFLRLVCEMLPYSEITKMFWYVFPLKLYSLSFMFRFIILIKLFFVDGVRYKLQFIFFSVQIDNYSCTICCKDFSFLSMNCFCTFVESQLTTCGVYFWSLCSLPFICILTLIQLFSLLYFCHKSQD